MLSFSLPIKSSDFSFSSLLFSEAILNLNFIFLMKLNRWHFYFICSHSIPFLPSAFSLRVLHMQIKKRSQFFITKFRYIKMKSFSNVQNLMTSTQTEHSKIIFFFLSVFISISSSMLAFCSYKRKYTGMEMYKCTWIEADKVFYVITQYNLNHNNSEVKKKKKK